MKRKKVRQHVTVSVTTTEQVAIDVSRTTLLELLREHLRLPDDARFSIRVRQGEDCCDGELVVDDHEQPLVVTYQRTNVRHDESDTVRALMRRRSQES